MQVWAHNLIMYIIEIIEFRVALVMIYAVLWNFVFVAKFMKEKKLIRISKKQCGGEGGSPFYESIS